VISDDRPTAYAPNARERHRRKLALPRRRIDEITLQKIGLAQTLGVARGGRGYQPNWGVSMQPWARWLLLCCVVLTCQSVLTPDRGKAADCTRVGSSDAERNDGCSLRPVPLTTPAAVHPKFSLSERYPGPWVEITQEIRDVLDRKKVRECGQAVGRQSSSNPGEYLLYCTRDEKHWTRWRVWPASHQMLGPGEIFATVAPPDGY
jgi:hypothetical protein